MLSSTLNIVGYTRCGHDHLIPESKTGVTDLQPKLRVGGARLQPHLVRSGGAFTPETEYLGLPHIAFEGA